MSLSFLCLRVHLNFLFQSVKSFQHAMYGIQCMVTYISVSLLDNYFTSITFGFRLPAINFLRSS